MSKNVLSARDASILTAIAVRPQSHVVGRMVEGLQGEFAREVAKALRGLDATEPAQETARVMLHWCEVKRDHARQQREERIRKAERELRRARRGR